MMHLSWWPVAMASWASWLWTTRHVLTLRRRSWNLLMVSTGPSIWASPRSSSSSAVGPKVSWFDVNMFIYDLIVHDTLDNVQLSSLDYLEALCLFLPYRACLLSAINLFINRTRISLFYIAVVPFISINLQVWEKMDHNHRIPPEKALWEVAQKSPISFWNMSE